MKFSPSFWQYVVSVKSTMKILSNFVAFLESTNFNKTDLNWNVTRREWKTMQLYHLPSPYFTLKKTAAFSFRCFVSGTEISPDKIEW